MPVCTHLRFYKRENALVAWFSGPLTLPLLTSQQKDFFGRARPPGGPSPRDSKGTSQKLPLHTGRPAVGPYQACRTFASFPELLSSEVANIADFSRNSP
jgi:hypothetical protein